MTDQPIRGPFNGTEGATLARGAHGRARLVPSSIQGTRGRASFRDAVAPHETIDAIETSSSKEIH